MVQRLTVPLNQPKGGRVKPVSSLKGLDVFSHSTQGLTTPTRAKAARVGDPGTPWAKSNSVPAGLDFV